MSSLLRSAATGTPGAPLLRVGASSIHLSGSRRITLSRRSGLTSPGPLTSLAAALPRTVSGSISSFSTSTSTLATSPGEGLTERHAFQTETKQLLNIVANSLYTDRHVFIRELVSNASDALEKARHRQASSKPLTAPDVPLSIAIRTDEQHNTIIIEDSGIGMTKQELKDCLGTIARSGSKAYLAQLRQEQQQQQQQQQQGAGAGAPSSVSAEVGSRIIGQFGVGFYSSFMVSEGPVTVYSRSADPSSPDAPDAGAGAGGEAPILKWSSSGDGSYEITPITPGAPGVEGSDLKRGTRVVIRLKETAKEFSNPATVKETLVRYSSFLSYPITLNGKPVNTVGAIWTKPPRRAGSSSTQQDDESPTDEQYTAFYKYKSGDFEDPLYRLHFASDAPIALKALLFVGTSHEEKHGLGRLRPGVDLYSRRVLIEPSSRIMPDWLRFVNGVVDSEDLPLNISRESMQDTALMRRLRSVLTRRVLRFLESEARRDSDCYNKRFFLEFGNFLKEGAVSDATYSPEIARLLRFESSQLKAGEMTSLDEYLSRCPPGQDSIYYLVAPHRGIAETSPYMEAFRGASSSSSSSSASPSPSSSSSSGTTTTTIGGGVEVLFLYSPLDDFVMSSLREYNGRKLVTVETAELDPTKLTGIKDKEAAKKELAKEEGKKDETTASKEGGDAAASSSAAGADLKPLSDAQLAELGEWLRSSLPGRISKVRATTRLKSSPAVVTDHESAAVRRMMRMVEQTAGRDSEALRQEAHMLPAQTLEVNASHPVIIRLNQLRTTQPKVALLLAEQTLDNALIAAGLVDDSRIMLPRLNALLELVANTAVAAGGTVGSAYSSYQDLVDRRYVSEREEKERRTLESSKKAVEETINPEVLRAVGEAAAKVAASGAGADAGQQQQHPVRMTEPAGSSSSSFSSSSASSSSAKGGFKTSPGPSAAGGEGTTNMKTGNNEVDALLAELEKTLKEAGVDPTQLGTDSASSSSSSGGDASGSGSGRMGRKKGGSNLK